MCEFCNNNSLEVNVNAHLHTPYSFSSFETLTDALDRALRENVQIVGINDFYTTRGYEQWDHECRRRRLYPLFNIEFISLNKEDQAVGIRVNDPNNPGRTYLSGKGLYCPPVLPEPYASQLAEVVAETDKQVRQMCGKLNDLLREHEAGFELDIDWIEKNLTQGSIRERHLAKALRLKATEHFGGDTDRITSFFERIFGGRPLQADLNNVAAVENEIRSKLLKAGGPAFVAEDPKAFLPMEDVRRIILAAGGIPTYPFLADDAKGGFTDFEQDVKKTAQILKERRIYSVEFITTRNSIEVLEAYAGYLHEQGFVVTFGSEHNTPAMEPILLSARGGRPLTPKLKAINYAGACVIAAHQEALNRGFEGYTSHEGMPSLAKRNLFIQEGNRLIRSLIR